MKRAEQSDIQKKITIVTGHYGSGKTEFAINYASKLRAEHSKVMVVDFDFVNPFFRAKDAKEFFKARDIKLVASKYAATNVDVPAVPSEILSAFESEGPVVFDVGGDSDGAVMLGFYKKYFKKQSDIDMLFVINERRPVTSTLDASINMINSIERISGLKHTGIINNTHLGKFTTVDDIILGQELANRLSEVFKIEVKYIVATETVAHQIPDEFKSKVFEINLHLLDFLDKN